MAYSGEGSWGKRWRWRDRFYWAWQNLIPLAALCLAFYAVEATVLEADRSARESAARRDQACTTDERAHLSDVKQLAGTYRYLLSLTPRQRREPLNQFILRALPKTEQDAREDPAPPFCDKPGVGLPEPDPVVPERPAQLK